MRGNSDYNDLSDGWLEIIRKSKLHACKMYLDRSDYVVSDVVLKPDLAAIFLCCDPTDICLEVSSPGRRRFMSFTSYSQWLFFF